jgi:hypothetical protein
MPLTSAAERREVKLRRMRNCFIGDAFGLDECAGD